MLGAEKRERERGRERERERENKQVRVGGREREQRYTMYGRCSYRSTFLGNHSMKWTYCSLLVHIIA